MATYSDAMNLLEDGGRHIDEDLATWGQVELRVNILSRVGSLNREGATSQRHMMGRWEILLWARSSSVTIFPFFQPLKLALE